MILHSLGEIETNLDKMISSYLKEILTTNILSKREFKMVNMGFIVHAIHIYPCLWKISTPHRTQGDGQKLKVG